MRGYFSYFFFTGHQLQVIDYRLQYYRLLHKMIPKISSLIALIVAIAGLYILIRNHLLLSWHPLTIAIQVFAVALMIWARITFGIRSFHGTANTTEGKLVTNGPYKYWRHPIYASIIYFIWASVIAYPFG
jgi:protein-S-isoprenylcysteine O-methyltransferase Ste14